MNDSTLRNPFISGSAISDRRFFIGRQSFLRDLVNHMSGAQPISVNIIGPHCIGKSSLLKHFVETWSDRLPEAVTSERYLVTYVPLKGVCDRSAFWGRLCDTISEQYANIGVPKEPLTQADFVNLLNYLTARNQLPVFCLDDFHHLFRYPAEFDGPFLDFLRSCIDASLLMFILATCEPISHYMSMYKEHHNITSGFNVGFTLTLGQFTPEEVTELLTLPQSFEKRLSPALSNQQQTLAKQWGGQDPCQLQKAAYFLCLANINHESERWAYRKFLEQQPTPSWWRRWLKVFKIWDYPQ